MTFVFNHEEEDSSHSVYSLLFVYSFDLLLLFFFGPFCVSILFVISSFLFLLSSSSFIIIFCFLVHPCPIVLVWVPSGRHAMWRTAAPWQCSVWELWA